MLGVLLALVPNRPLTPSETRRIAELQANHLLGHFQIETSSVPEEIVSELPRLRVVREDGLPTGLACLLVEVLRLEDATTPGGIELGELEP